MRAATAPLRIGFLGAGLIAGKHATSLRASGAEARGEMVPAGVYDPVPERAAAFAGRWGFTACRSEDEVLDGCDAVYVCAWTSEHPRLVSMAAARGLAVFCEKPLAIDTATAAAMAREVEAAGVVHQVGLILRRSASYRWARHLVASPDSGRVMSVVFRDDQFIPIQGHYASTWRAQRELVGSGTLLEHSIHDVDMLRFLVGEIAEVGAQTADFHGNDGIEDVATATIRFAGGALGTLTSVWHDNLSRPSQRRVEIFCERRFVSIEGDDANGPVHWIDPDGSSSTLAGDALVAAAAPLMHGTMNPDGEFVGSVLAGSPAHPDFHTAVHAHRVVDAMYRSAASGGSMIAVDRD